MFRIIQSVLLLFPFWLTAQMSFESSTSLTENQSRNAGLPLAVVDMNNDLLDDVVLLDKGTELIVAYQMPLDPEFTQEVIGSVGDEHQWSMVVGDIDANGWNDVIVAGAYDGVKFFYQDSGQFELVIQEDIDLFAQAMNLVDIDNDGWLDLFICNDIGWNKVYWNEEGVMKEDTSDLFRDLSYAEAKGNYGSEWIDIDEDGDQDLLIAKCYAGSDDPYALQRVNRLYINNGDGTFNEEGKVRGLANGAQSWTGHAFDSDSDGDFDWLVTNHDGPAQLMINDGEGFFTDQTAQSGLQIVGPVIQSLGRDLDYDGRHDILIGGFPDYLYKNVDGTRFRAIRDVLGSIDIVSMAIGDLNNDGRHDIYSAHLGLVNRPTSRPDVTYFNRSRGNVVNIYLQDNINTGTGHGAKVLTYQDGRATAHTIRSGESYGIQNSFKLAVGLGERIVLDSVVVQWANGDIQKASKVRANQYVLFHRAGKVIRQQDIQIPLRDTLCRNEVIELTGPEGGRVYRWNGTAIGRTLSVSNEGFFQLDIDYEDGVKVRLPGSSIIEYGGSIDRSLNLLEGDTVNCAGQSVEITYDEHKLINWSSGERSKSLEIEETGWYSGEMSTKCAIEPLDSIFIRLLSPQDVEVLENDGAGPGKEARIIIRDTGVWYRSLFDDDPLFIGDTMVINELFSDSTLFVANRQQFDFPTRSIGKKQVDARIPFHKDELNATMLFDVQRPALLKSVDVKTDRSGLRRILLLNEAGDILDAHEAVLDTGWNTLPVNFVLSPEEELYRLTTDLKINEQTLGTRSPRLMSCDSNISYPYIWEGVFRLLVAQYGFNTYNYFYDWQVEPLPLECLSDRKVVVARLRTTTKDPDGDEESRVYPNPSTGLVCIENMKDDTSLEVFDLLGRQRTISHTVQRDAVTMTTCFRLNEDGIYIVKSGKDLFRVVVKK